MARAASIKVSVRISWWRRAIVLLVIRTLIIIDKAGVPLPANTESALTPILSGFLARGIKVTTQPRLEPDPVNL